MEAIQEDMGEGILQCTNHTYKNNTTPGGICAFCLQEKLGILVSSSPTPSIQANHFDKTPNVTLLETDEVGDYRHKKKGFWSFLHYSSSKHLSTARKTEKPAKDSIFPSSSSGASLNGSVRSNKNKNGNFQVYSRSRSVGYGSRSFSGDFIENISTGLDDCTLHRIEENGNGKFRVKGKSWGWVLASPMRALIKKREVLKKNDIPNLDSIPSLLTVRN